MNIYTNLNQTNLTSKTIITIGNFDGMHLGHQKIFQKINEIKKQHNLQSLVFTFSNHPQMVLNTHTTSISLLSTIDDKIKLIKNQGIDHLIAIPFTKAFSQITAQDYIKNILVNQFKAHTIVIGYDHNFGLNKTGNITMLKDFLHTYHYNVIEISAFEINQCYISSSIIREHLKNGNVQEANTLLGYKYQLSGVVIKGKQLGRTIGYPTANIKPDELKLIPKIGIYAVRVSVNNTTYNGMLSIGLNPTTDTDNTIKLEVNIFDFNANIYNEKISIEFISYLRNEIKFKSLDLLIQQLDKDKANCLNT